MFFYFDPVYLWYVFIPVLIISLLVQIFLQSTFRKWSKIKNGSGLNGIQVGRELFALPSLNAIPLEVTPGALSDHFDPRANVVRLSKQVASRSTVAAMAVTAHELGHVQQYQSGSAMIKARNLLLPALQFSPTISYIAILLGLIFNMTNMIWVGVFFFALMVLFSFLTLPIEIDASRRGLKLLNQARLIKNEQDKNGSRAVLFAAAMTYLAAAVTSLLQLLYYVNMARRRS